MSDFKKITLEEIQKEGELVHFHVFRKYYDEYYLIHKHRVDRFDELSEIVQSIPFTETRTNPEKSTIFYGTHEKLMNEFSRDKITLDKLLKYEIKIVDIK